MTDRIDILRKKLSRRESVPGYEKNCEMLRAEIQRLDDNRKVASGKHNVSVASKD